MAEIRVFDEPVAKPRPRFGRGRVFTPRRAERAEDRIRQAWTDADHGVVPGPVSIRIVVRVKRPAGHFNPPRKDGTRTRSSAWLPVPISRPDWDNYAKTVCDALNGVAYFDDSTIVEAEVYKLYADDWRDPFHGPGWTISVEEWSDVD